MIQFSTFFSFWTNNLSEQFNDSHLDSHFLYEPVFLNDGSLSHP